MATETETPTNQMSLVEQKQALERATAQRIKDLMAAREKEIADHETALKDIAAELKALGHKQLRGPRTPKAV